MTDKPTQKIDAETNTPAKPKRTRKSKFNSDAERHAAVLASKRRYYQRNAELYRLKSLRVYYINQLAAEDLSNIKKEKYERKLRELVAQIQDFIKATEPTDSTDSNESSDSTDSNFQNN